MNKNIKDAPQWYGVFSIINELNEMKNKKPKVQMESEKKTTFPYTKSTKKNNLHNSMKMLKHLSFFSKPLLISNPVNLDRRIC